VGTGGNWQGFQTLKKILQFNECSQLIPGSTQQELVGTGGDLHWFQNLKKILQFKGCSRHILSVFPQAASTRQELAGISDFEKKNLHLRSVPGVFPPVPGGNWRELAGISSCISLRFECSILTWVQTSTNVIVLPQEEDKNSIFLNYILLQIKCISIWNAFCVHNCLSVRGRIIKKFIIIKYCAS